MFDKILENIAKRNENVAKREALIKLFDKKWATGKILDDILSEIHKLEQEFELIGK